MTPTSFAPAVRAFAAVVILSAPSTRTAVFHAQAFPPQLEFHGLRVGIPIPDLRATLRELGGSLGCRGSRDPRLDECTGTIRLEGFRYSVIVSSVRDSAAVIILTGAVPRDSVAAWADALAPIQGTVEPRTRGPQRTWQWVRRRQMLRLIHRREGGRETATVTLTDGPLLDGLSRPDG